MTLEPLPPSHMQALAGSLLVYNTGRSLGQFVGLMRSCEGRVAVPDVLITAVGTKVRCAVSYCRLHCRRYWNRVGRMKQEEEEAKGRVEWNGR